MLLKTSKNWKRYGIPPRNPKTFVKGNFFLRSVKRQHIYRKTWQYKSNNKMFRPPMMKQNPQYKNKHLKDFFNNVNEKQNVPKW